MRMGVKWWTSVSEWGPSEKTRIVEQKVKKDATVKKAMLGVDLKR